MATATTKSGTSRRRPSKATQGAAKNAAQSQTESPAAEVTDTPQTPAEQPVAAETAEAAAPAKTVLTGNTEFWGQFVPEGYVLTSWLRAHYALIKKQSGATVEGPAWLTVTKHGAVKPAERGADAEQNGRDRAQWDPASAAEISASEAAKADRKAKAEAKAAEKADKADKAEDESTDDSAA